MKQRDFICHLERFGCQLVCHEKRHSAYWNPANRKVTTVPRHIELEDSLCGRICEELGIPPRLLDFTPPPRVPGTPMLDPELPPMKGTTPLIGYRVILRTYRTAEMEDSFEWLVYAPENAKSEQSYFLREYLQTYIDGMLLDESRLAILTRPEIGFERCEFVGARQVPISRDALLSLLEPLRSVLVPVVPKEDTNTYFHPGSTGLELHPPFHPFKAGWVGQPPEWKVLAEWIREIQKHFWNLVRANEPPREDVRGR